MCLSRAFQSEGTKILMRYAIIQTGGKQVRVEEGMRLQLERLNLAEGSPVQLREVLFLKNGESAKIGQPFVSGASVSATILRHLRGPKVIIFKKRPKKGYKKRKGHRQELTEIEIQEIKS